MTIKYIIMEKTQINISLDEMERIVSYAYEAGYSDALSLPEFSDYKNAEDFWIKILKDLQELKIDKN
jgi:hypothetical protein